jgi:hypothetical protein
MDRSQIHFELFVRRHARAPWVLTLASEDRAAVIEAAEAARAASPAAAVRVCKETCDASSGEFRPLVLLERGTRPRRKAWRQPRLAATPAAAESERPACARPEDLYAPHARAVIGQVLAGWLARNAVTPFELLHRADLAERLEACEAELSAAIYNAAAGEGAARGGKVEPMRATLTALVRQAVDRLVRAKAGAEESPSLALGMAIAVRLKDAEGWRAKVETLLALIASADRSGPAAELARRRLQQPLAEALGGDGDLEDILGVAGLGEQMLTLVQIAAPPAACAAARRDEAMRRALPPLTGFPARLAAELQASALLTRTRRAVAARALRILASETRLWPNAPEAELEGVLAAFALLRASERLVDPADVDAAETARWRVLASPDFVEQRLLVSKGALEDADILLDFVNAARGQAAIADLGRRLAGVLGGETFMAETRFGPDTARLRRAVLVTLRRRVAASALAAEAKAEADFLISRIANLIDADGVGVSRGPILIAHRGG